MNKERYINKLNKIKESGNYRMLRDVQHNGFLIHYNEREMLNLSSNDYLGLASNPVLYEDFRKETDVKLLSYSAVSSRLLSGNHEYYSLLENDLSDLYGKEAALVLNSGYHANIGILPAVADLQELCDLKREYDTFLYVDEAHAVGVRGTNGLGCCEEQGCIDDIDFIVGTFGKAFASYGAFVVCDEMFREFLVNTQRSLIFTTALPPVNVAWTRFILNRMPDFYSYRMKLSGIAEQLRTTLANRGFETRGDSHIVPFLCGSNENSVYMSELFQDNGFFVLPVRYPTVPKNEARIRFSLNAAIPEEDYDCLMEFIEISL